MADPLKPGERAPDFTAQGSDGRTYDLAGLVKESPVLLIFYPGNNTPG
jgi:peroxiredoxin Q/BCP